jgi:hypothetical protein
MDTELGGYGYGNAVIIGCRGLIFSTYDNGDMNSSQVLYNDTVSVSGELGLFVSKNGEKFTLCRHVRQKRSHTRECNSKVQVRKVRPGCLRRRGTPNVG